MVPTFYRGIPVGNLQRVNRLTVPGSLIDVNRYRYSHGINEANALLAVQAAASGNMIPRARSPYNRALTTNVYALNGLGDTEHLPAAVGGGANPVGGSWFNVLNTVVGNISQGVACKISGACKPTTPLMLAGGGSSVPWDKVALAGGGALLLVMMLRRRAA